MAESNFVTVADGSSTQTEIDDDSTYAEAAPVGVVPGIASAAFANKMWHQSSLIADAVAKVISEDVDGHTGVDAKDSETASELAAKIRTAIQEVAAEYIEKTSKYLPVSGGTMTGGITSTEADYALTLGSEGKILTADDVCMIYRATGGLDWCGSIFRVGNSNIKDTAYVAPRWSDTGILQFKVGYDANGGSSMLFNSVSTSGNKGRFAIFAHADDADSSLYGNAGGSLAWTGTAMQAAKFTTNSDRRIKKDITYHAVDLGELKPVAFRYKTLDDGVHVGLIAQDVQKALPEAVDEYDDEESGEKRLSIDYSAVTAVLVGEVNRLRKALQAAGIAIPDVEEDTPYTYDETEDS